MAQVKKAVFNLEVSYPGGMEHKLDFIFSRREAELRKASILRSYEEEYGPNVQVRIIEGHVWVEEAA